MGELATVNGNCLPACPSWKQLLTTLDATFEEAKAAVLTQVDPSGSCPVLGHLAKVLEYNVPHGKKSRGVTLLYTWAVFSGDDGAGDSVKLACPAAWAVEALQASFLVHDDIMDGSLTRRGRPCWFRNEGIGMMAVNDGIFLDQAVYALLSSAYSSHPQYTRLVDLFHSVTMTTSIGQTLDMSLGVFDLSWDAYREMVCRKTAHYSFYLPVAAALLLRQRHHLMDAAKQILLRIGEYFQAQDDYLDFYGDPAVTGKIGTDIQEAKCSWLALTALDRLQGDEPTRQRFLANYGHSDAERVAAVGEIYRSLRLDDAYAKFDEAEYARLGREVDALECEGLRSVCHVLLDTIHGRQK